MLYFLSFFSSFYILRYFFFFFFFQAEDGIRDLTVTGVQTCALPICCRRTPSLRESWKAIPRVFYLYSERFSLCLSVLRLRLPMAGRAWQQPKLLRRSEERRVGKECRSRWSREA